MTDPANPRPTRFRTGGLSPRKPTRFSYRPDAGERATLAQDLGLISLHRLDLTGEIRPAGRDELVLEATLTAAADQACSITLAPVPATVSETVRRRYVAGLETPEGDEVEMPEDDSVEPMPELIDLAEVAAEALALALPLYPRAPGAEFAHAVHAAEGVTPLSDADLKPFAGLQGLAAKLAAKEEPGPEGDE
ncbi:YceD family protein [Tabrizicola sp.]|uniref:YceD family protein n=1 Tax=Tabrizicola sp. TaxID=2005166 RepID=UPI002FDD837A